MRMNMRRGLICAALAIFTGGFANRADAITFDEILGPLRKTEGNCRQLDGVYSRSMQARTLYDMGELRETLRVEPREKAFESYECGHHRATVYLYLYSDPPAAQDALSTIQTFIWGEKHKSYLHPEDIFTVENAVVVVSGEKPEPVTQILLGGEGTVSAKDEAKAEKEFEKARKAYLKKDYKAAEEHFRAVIQMIPSHLGSRMSLAHSLFYQSKFGDAVPEYERALSLKEKAKSLSQTEERILIDNLGMAYGLSGHLDKGKQFYEDAIKKDADYPNYYYDLACTVAELGDLEAAIANLKLGFERRANCLPGESYPDPRTDDSFKKFLGNEKFEAALKEMGF